jgi:galactonate dehydratase
MAQMWTRRELLRTIALSSAAPLSPLVAAAADPATLRISRVEPFTLRIGGRSDIVCARVQTEDGYHGWGEGTTPPTASPVATTIRSLEKLLKGESAWHIEKLWRRMYIAEENTLGGTLYAAISAIDIALWDIVGKKLNAPVYKLLGGLIHDKIRIYTSYRWGNIPRTRDAYLQRTKELMAQGATAGKYDPFGPYPGPERQLSSVVLHEVREMIRGIREAGETFDICVEAHGKFNMATAGRIIKMLEPFDPFFLEEPIPPENMDAMAALQASTNIPIATGEGIQGHFHYAPLLGRRAARILQPDVARTGGITAMKKIASMADAHYVTFAPHNPNGPVCTAASLHVAASSPNFLIMEEGNTRVDEYNDIFAGGWKPTLSEWRVPEAPGLGVDFSPEFLKDHTAKTG